MKNISSFAKFSFTLTNLFYFLLAIPTGNVNFATISLIVVHIVYEDVTATTVQWSDIRLSYHS